MRTRQLSSRRARILLIVAGLMCLLAIRPAAPVDQNQTTGEVYVATLKGVINPLSASYLHRAISKAQEADARALVLQLDTPGGLESSTREMSQDILGSSIPVVVYVAPSGARAASAGMFITISANIAAMAPGTNIGAAHPVALGGDQDEIMASKVVEDSAATARSIATLRGRNADWSERAVRESLSATAEEALELNVIDLVAPTLEDLLSEIHGQQVTTAVGDVILDVENARQVPIPMTILETILHIITDPNIAYLLLTIGAIGIIAELYNPGSLIPGIAGMISLALAFVALGTLPIGWAGVGLILLAIGLMIGELESEGFGVLGIGAIVAFVLGSLLLFVPLTPVSPSLPAVGVDLWVIALMTITMALFLLLVLGKAVQSRKSPVRTGIEGLIGQHGRAVTNLAPSGTVSMNGEQWSAQSTDEEIEAGTEVEIVGVSGVILHVRPATEPQETIS